MFMCIVLVLVGVHQEYSRTTSVDPFLQIYLAYLFIYLAKHTKSVTFGVGSTTIKNINNEL